MSTFSFRLTEDERKLIEEYAKAHNISAGELVRETTLEKIEDSVDIELFKKAMEQNEPTYSHDEVKKELGIE